MILDIMIYTEEDLLKLKEKSKENNKLTNYGKNKVHFICSKCNKNKTKAIYSLSIPFICASCNNSTAQLKQETKNKIEKTNIEKYGYKYTAQVPKFRNIQKNTYEKHKKEDKNFVNNITTKREESYKNKTGYSNPKQNPEVQKKIEKTNIERYGVSNPSQSKEIQNKIKRIKKKRYGDEYYTNREKSSKTYHEHYDNNITEQIKLKNKKIETNNKKYGANYWQQNKDYYNKHKHNTKLFYDNNFFDSRWELAYYIWLKDHNIRFIYHPDPIEYYWSEHMSYHKYYPDFKLWNNTYIELKRPDLYEKMITGAGSQENAKYLCMVQNKVKIYTDCSFYEKYINEVYGYNYLNHFKYRFKL